MRIFLFGASGATGKEVLALLLSKGCHVKALVRSPEDFKFPSSANLSIVKGDVYIPQTYQNELNGIDVVISALGTGTNRKATKVYSEGGKNILAAMRNAGIKKIITLTAAAFDTTDPGNRNIIVKYIVQPLFKNIYADMILWEQLLEKNTDIDWICVRPSRLVSKPYMGKYRIGINHCPKGGGKIARKDVADFIVKQISSGEYIRQKPVIAY